MAHISWFTKRRKPADQRGETAHANSKTLIRMTDICRATPENSRCVHNRPQLECRFFKIS
jgi:hypothetical protein